MALLGMHRRLVQALLVCIALAVALLVPLRAQAAILPACENRELLTPAPAPAPSIMFADAEPSALAVGPQAAPSPDPSCVVPSEEAGADPKAAPICDPRGASAVAPPRVLPVNDTSIGAPPACELEISSPMIGPAPRSSSPVHAALAFALHATITVPDMVPSAPSELGPAYPPVKGDARAGTRRGVYHPPR